MNRSNINVSPHQREAITFAEGAMLVLAGPGSGKTHVITRRIRYLIEEKNVNPAHILTITFTKAAALEMQKRCHQICPASVGAVFGTFHSVFYHILRTSSEYQNFSVISEHDKMQIVQKILSGYEDERGCAPFTPEDFLQKLSRYKNCLSIQDQEDEVFLKAAKRYDRACMDMQRMDFDHMLVFCLAMFSDHPEEKEKWQKRFRYILVDEFQDVNGLQYELIKVMAQISGNLFAVGDDDQAIYSFRGSDPVYMKRFLEDYPDCRQILLDQNYRCGGEIVAAASKCIANNKHRFPKEMKAAGDFQNTVQIQAFDTMEEEMRFMEERIKKAENGETTAILLRTNAMAEYVAEHFLKMQIPCVWKDKRKTIYERPVVQAITAILSFVHCGNKRSDFLAFMNKPYRGILREDLKSDVVDLKHLQTVYGEYREIREALHTLEKQCDFLRGMDPFGAVTYILHGMKYRAYMIEGAGSVAEAEEIERMIGELLAHAKMFRTTESFLKFIKNYKSEEQKKMPRKGDGETVRIMTFHAAKGLEFDHVLLPEINCGMVPKGNMLTPEQMEEERRMFYVAMTRAKKTLYICYRRDNMGQGESVFIKELKSE